MPVKDPKEELLWVPSKAPVRTDSILRSTLLSDSPHRKSMRPIVEANLMKSTNLVRLVEGFRVIPVHHMCVIGQHLEIDIDP